MSICIYILILLFFCKTISCIDEKGILVTHYFSLSRGYILIIKIGSQSDPIMLNINMVSDRNVIVHQGLEIPNDFYTYQNESFFYYDELVDSIKLSGNIVMSYRYNISDFVFNYVTESDNFGSIGLAYKYSDKQSNILYLMKEQGLIKRMEIGFGPETGDEEEGEIYFGGIPSSIKNKRESVSLKVKTIDSYWGTNLQYISINNTDTNVYLVKGRAYFQSNIKHIQVPREFFSYLNTTLFHEYIQNQTCYIEESNNYLQFKCKCFYTQYIPSLTFVIDGIAFDISNRNLFDQYSFKTCSYYIFASLSDSSSDFILGVSFYKGGYTSFDYENGLVQFYRKKNKYLRVDMGNYNKVRYQEMERYMIMGCNMLLVVASVINILLKRKKYI